MSVELPTLNKYKIQNTKYKHAATNKNSLDLNPFNCKLALTENSLDLNPFNRKLALSPSAQAPASAPFRSHAATIGKQDYR